MSDSASFPPAEEPFDPARDRLPPALEWDAQRPATVVLLLDAADDRRWAADAAVALASAWARAGRRVVLADLHLEEPLLHDRLGEQNLDGVVDIFLYGASLARTARPVAGRGFYLISAGTYTPDADDVLRHPRWQKILAGFHDAQATLFLFAPAAGGSVDALASLAGTAVVLGDGAPRRLPAGVRVRGALRPATAAEVLPPVPAAEDPALEDRTQEAPDREDLTLEDLWGPPLPPPVAAPAPVPPRETRAPAELVEERDLFEPRRDPLIGEYADGIPATTLPAGALRPARQPDLTEPPPPPPPDRKRGKEGAERKASPVLLVVLVFALLFAWGYYFYTTRPDLVERARGLVGIGTPAAPGAQSVPEPAAPAPRPVPAARAGALPYSVHVAAYPSLAAARQLVQTDGARFGEVPFIVSLEWIDQVPYYRVLAGTLPDTLSAGQLRTRLVEAGAVDPDGAQGSWNLLQFTPLAFDLGEFPTREAAQARADSLLALEVPSYALAAPQGWRLYGGAYRDSTAAEGMRRLLEEKRVRASLVPRTGSTERAGG